MINIDSHDPSIKWWVAWVTGLESDIRLRLAYYKRQLAASTNIGTSVSSWSTSFVLSTIVISYINLSIEAISYWPTLTNSRAYLLSIPLYNYLILLPQRTTNYFNIIRAKILTIYPISIMWEECIDVPTAYNLRIWQRFACRQQYFN
jgi:hypothetical protein